MLEAIIFDVDGTLVDSVDLHTRAWQEAFAHFGHRVSFEEVRAQIGKGGDQIIPYLLPGPRAKEIGAQLDKYRARHFAEHYLNAVKPFPKVRALFEALRSAGKRTALASSAKDRELEHYKRLTGLDGLVDAQTTSEDAERSKPYPDIFQAALHALGDPGAASCVVIGDSPYDAQAATRAGLRSIGVRSGGFPEAVLREAGFVALYDDPAALLHAYQQRGDDALSATADAARAARK